MTLDEHGEKKKTVRGGRKKTMRVTGETVYREKEPAGKIINRGRGCVVALTYRKSLLEGKAALGGVYGSWEEQRGGGR